jgi:transcriptional regulator with XRE-family HTH domain
MKTKNLGKQLQEAREKKGITRKDLAKKMKVDQSSIWLWEKNKRVPGGIKLLSLLKILETEVELNR